jgi:hypothetical protein
MASLVPIEYIRIPIPCTNPSCRQQSMELLRECLQCDSVSCAYCGHKIDISHPDWRTFLQSLFNTYNQFRGYIR